MRHYRSICLLACLALLAACVPSSADGFMLPASSGVPRFSVPYHRVQVTIDHQVATTEIDQAFHSNAGQPIEGTYIFPIAEGMSLSKFTMTANNEELPHRILERDEARRIYNGIVQQQRDPALLEWLGARMIKASVFPIQPGEDKRIRIAYQEVLPAQGGAVKYVYPLRTEKLSARPLRDCSVDITIRSAHPLRSIYSPTHAVTVTRRGPNEAVAHYAAHDVLPDQDLVLYYTMSEEKLGLDLLTYRDPRDGDGYFLLLAAPDAQVRADEVLPKDVVFVLDISGSMAEDGKIAQAKAALRFCLQRLDPRDRFNVVAFNTGIHPWQSGLQRATREHVAAADRYFSGLKAAHNTDIDDALGKALQMLSTGEEGRARSIIFLTDGLPTDGVTDTEAILTNARTRNTLDARIFDFGVGEKYNAHLLDRLAEDSHGVADNVLPGESITDKVTGFYAKVASPLLRKLHMDWGGMQVSEQYPHDLPDLYTGSQLVIVGRYTPRQALQAQIALTGMAAGRLQTTAATVNFPANAQENDFIPRLWATRKIGYLEDQLRLHGGDQRTLEEIIHLSKEFGILSQYASFLVDMDNSVPGKPVPMAAVSAPASLARENMSRVYDARNQFSGAGAVEQSANSKQKRYADQFTPQDPFSNGPGRRATYNQLRNTGQRTFVQSGEKWLDLKASPTGRIIKVQAFSPAYLQLANAHPRMAQYLSLGTNVTVTVNDLAVEIGADGQREEFTPAELTTLKTKMDAEFGAPPA
ncbi:MAG TPA: VIT and VWA domain-containing protein, partial [Armatimonadota bacterium]